MPDATGPNQDDMRNQIRSTNANRDAVAVIAAKQKDLADLVGKAQKLQGDGIRTAEQSRDIEAIMAKIRPLRAEIAQDAELNDLSDWAGRSAGQLGLANPDDPNGAQFERFGAAKEMGLPDRHGGSRAYRMDEKYNEGVYDKSVTGAIKTDAYRSAWRDWVRLPPGGSLPEKSYRAIAEGADTSGGFLVPEDFMQKIIAREPTPTRVAGRVTQLQTGRDAMVIPRLDVPSGGVSNDDPNNILYTTGIRVKWTGETPVSAASIRANDPLWGNVRVPVHTAMFSLVVSLDMLEDSAFPLISYISDKFSETVDLTKDNVILNGTGQGQPAGFLLNPGGTGQPAIGATSAVSGLVDAASIVKTAMTLPEQYDENSCWVMSKTSTGNAIAGLVDTANRPLWGMGVDDAGLQSGYLNRPLVGYPVVFSGFMPSVAASANVALFGDLRGYYLVNRVGFTIQILRELYAETNQVLILGRFRIGGQVAEPWRTQTLKLHA